MAFEWILRIFRELGPSISRKKLDFSERVAHFRICISSELCALYSFLHNDMKLFKGMEEFLHFTATIISSIK